LRPLADLQKANKEAAKNERYKTLYDTLAEQVDADNKATPYERSMGEPGDRDAAARNDRKIARS